MIRREIKLKNVNYIFTPQQSNFITERDGFFVKNIKVYIANLPN